ncbi:MAG: response regulator [bacterium]
MAEKLRILHVDDEEDTLKVVKTILDKEGYEVVSVLSGKSALEQVELDNFSLILLDIMMPDMSGWDLFTRIGTFEKKYNVVFLTILEVSKERLAELKERGVKDYITKPFDRNDLVARVKKVIES